MFLLWEIITLLVAKEVFSPETQPLPIVVFPAMYGVLALNVVFELGLYFSK